MNIARTLLLAGVATLALSTGKAHAQGGPPIDTTMRPAVSPYSLLTGRDRFGGVPYQTLVLPQIQQQQINANQRAATARLQAEINATSGRPNQTVNMGVRPTGRQRGSQPIWNNYGHFYPTKRN